MRALIAALLIIATSAHVAFGASEETNELNRAIGFFAGTVDEVEANQLFLKAAQTGDSLAKMWLAKLKNEGLCGFPQDLDAATNLAANVFPLVLQLASNGNRQAQFLIGDCYMSGLGVEWNKSEATRWLTRAAEQEHELALYDLAVMSCNPGGPARYPDDQAFGKAITNLIDNFDYYGPYKGKVGAFSYVVSEVPSEDRYSLDDAYAIALYTNGPVYVDGIVPLSYVVSEVPSEDRYALERDGIGGVYTNALVYVDGLVQKMADAVMTKVMAEDIDHDGKQELMVCFHSGAWAWGSVEIYRISDKGLPTRITLSEEFYSKGEGHRGHDVFSVSNGILYAEYPIYLDGDGIMEPTGGSARYKLVLPSGKWVEVSE